MSRRNSFRVEESEESEIDLTPMLDVVFIMLIFFIVTASFIKESGIEVTRPESNQENQVATENKNVVMLVTANNEIWMDGRRIDIRAIRANIERKKAENPEAAVIINANDQAKAETFTAIIDAAREVGIYDVSLATKE